MVPHAREYVVPPTNADSDIASWGPAVKQLAARLARNQLIQNAAALYGVQVARKVLPLVIVPYLARILEPSGWGVMAFTQSLAEFVVLVIEFGFNLSATREIARNRHSTAACGEIMA